MNGARKSAPRIIPLLAARLSLVLLGLLLLALPDAPRERRAAPYPALDAPRRLDAAYAGWKRSYEERGGDRAFELALGWSKGLSLEHTQARGVARLDLLAGEVEVTVEQLTDPAVTEVWVVDNLPGAGRSVLPEPGDRWLPLGRLESAGGGRGPSDAHPPAARLRASLGANTLAGIEVDLVVIGRAGLDPSQSRVLVGAPTLFQRVYSRERRGLPGVAPSPAPTVAAPSLFASPAFATFSTPPPVELPTFDPLVQQGADLFFGESFGGNGRTCGTCHPAHNNLTIDPAFIATLRSRDPLFVAEFQFALRNNFENPKLMRELGLILENADGFGDLAHKFTMRGVPHVLAQSTSLEPGNGARPPHQRTGWSGDGAPGGGTLREFAIGAVTQHFTKTLQRRPGVDFRLPSDEQLDALEAFQLFLGRDADPDLATLRPKSTLAERGRQLFLQDSDQGGTVAAGKCNRCHANAGANASFAPGRNVNFDTGVEGLPDQPADLLDPTRNPPDGGFGTAPHPTIAGAFGDGTFNTPPLVEAADTPPFFHNNSVATLEEAINFYNSTAFNRSPGGQAVGGIRLEATQVQAIAALLRVLNALENIRTAEENGEFIEDNVGTVTESACESLGALAFAEIGDAIEVLEQAHLHPRAVARLESARVDFDVLQFVCDEPDFLPLYVEDGLAELRAARAELIVVPAT